jgi:hypothetical protein
MTQTQAPSFAGPAMALMMTGMTSGHDSRRTVRASAACRFLGMSRSHGSAVAETEMGEPTGFAVLIGGEWQPVYEKESVLKSSAAVLDPGIKYSAGK